MQELENKVNDMPLQLEKEYARGKKEATGGVKILGNNNEAKS